MAVEGWSYSHNHDPVLHQAAFYGDLARIKSLLKETDHMEQINEKNRLGCTPLRLAATAGHTDCVSYLLKQGADIEAADIKGQTALFVAIKNKRVDCLRLLLQQGANPNGSKQCLCTPIYIAAMEGFHAGVQELVEHGADLNLSQPHMGIFINTPLYISMAYGHLSCFKELLLGGADPNFNIQKSQPCITLYHTAVKRNVDVVFVELLYDFGTYLNVTDTKGFYPWEITGFDNQCKEFLQQVHDMPRSLKGLSRLQIRHALGRNRLQYLHKLPLPAKIIDFLLYNT